MLPSPAQYHGGFPPRDPRLPSLGRYPQLVGGQDVSHEAMAAFEERQAPLKQIAYTRTGRDGPTQVAHESRETGMGPDEAVVPPWSESEEENEPVRPYGKLMPESGSEATISPPQSPRLRSTLGSAITGVGGSVRDLVNDLGRQAGEAFQHNIEDSMKLGRHGARVVRQVASLAGAASTRAAAAAGDASIRASSAGDASMRAVSAGAGRVHEAISSAVQPGSNPRKAVHAAASLTATAPGRAGGSISATATTASGPTAR